MLLIWSNWYALSIYDVLKNSQLNAFYCFVLAIWIAVTSAAILALPPMFEREVQEFSNMEAQEQKKVRALHLLLMYSSE